MDVMSAPVVMTARQLQILRLVALGYTNVRIAHELRLTTHGVAWHIRRILTVLSARDRAHAVAIAYETGLLGGSIAVPNEVWARCAPLISR